MFSVEDDLLLTSEELFDPAGLVTNNWLKKSVAIVVGLPAVSPCSVKHKIPLLNQARAGRRPARAWFLEITLMRTSVCVCLCVRPPGY